MDRAQLIAKVGQQAETRNAAAVGGELADLAALNALVVEGVELDTFDDAFIARARPVLEKVGRSFADWNRMVDRLAIATDLQTQATSKDRLSGERTTLLAEINQAEDAEKARVAAHAEWLQSARGQVRTLNHGIENADTAAKQLAVMLVDPLLKSQLELVAK